MGHYFSETPSVASDPRTVELTLPDVHLALATDSGVFSAGRIDPGTRFLLRHMADHPPPGEPTSILDLGCGYGAIALATARRHPEAIVHGIDVNERALDLARRNAERNDVDNARFSTPDDVADGTEFDLIVSNPPIRVGKRALHDLLERWFGRLRPHGVALLVVQKHLGSDSLAVWLTDRGWPTRRLASRSGYRILEVSAAAPGAGATG